MSLHFEDVWEEGEKLHTADNSSTEAILEELLLKINLYKIISLKSEIPLEESKKIKSRTMGEILLTMAHLSLKEDINVFQALKTANQYRAAENLSKIPKELKLPGRK